MNRKRLDYLDAAKGIAILLTVLGHIGFVGERLLFFIFSFHMPLFFIVTGVIASARKPRPFKETLKRRALSLMMPYILFSVMGIMVFFVVENGILKTQSGYDVILSMFFDTLTLKGSFVFWFFPVMFFASLLFEGVARKLNGYVNLTLSVITIILLTLFGRKAELFFAQSSEVLWKAALMNLGLVFVRTVVALVFMVAGFYFGKQVTEKEIIGKVTDSALKRTGIAVTGVLLWCILIITSWRNGSVDFSSIHFSNGVLYFFNAFLGTLGCLMISLGLTFIKPLLWVGKNSIGIMVSHINLYFVYFAEVIALKASKVLFGTNNKTDFTDINSTVCSITAFLIATGLSVLFTFITVRFLPWVYGRKRAK